MIIHSSLTMEKYIVKELIGEGSFGRVFEGISKTTKERVALKLISKSTRTPAELEQFRHECVIQEGLKHANIVSMLDHVETPDHIIVVTELARGDLAGLLREKGQLPVLKMQYIAIQLVQALLYLHERRILHRDIKPQNVLIGYDNAAKLCDFGFAKTMAVDIYVLTSVKGTPLYMAPEIINREPYDHNADIWSLGCILYEIVVGHPPFCSSELFVLIDRIQKNEVFWPTFLTGEAKSFLQGLLEKNPKNRLSWGKLEKHAFLRDCWLFEQQEGNNNFPLTKVLSPSQERLKEEQKAQLRRKYDGPSRRLRKTMKVGEDTRRNVNINAQETGRDQLKCSPTHFKATAEPQNTPRRGIPLLSPSNNTKYDCDKSDNESVSSYETMSSSSSSKSCTSDDEKTVIMQGNSGDCKTAVNGNHSKYRNSSPTAQLEAAMEELNLGKDGKFHGSCSLWKSHPSPASHASSTDAQPIQNEEWIYFVSKTMKEAQEAPQTLCEKHFLHLLVAPLRNYHADSTVVEKIAVLLAMPFPLLQHDRVQLTTLENLYHESKVLPNLLRSCQLIVKRKIDKMSSSFSARRKKLEIASILDDEDLEGLDKCMRLITFLSHAEKKFISQLCESIRLLQAIPLLLMFLTLHTRRVRITIDTLSILCQFLRTESAILNGLPANAQVVECLILGLQKVNNEDLLRLLSHSDPTVQSKTLRLCAHAISQSAEIRDKCIVPKINTISSILLDARDSSHDSVKQAAEFFKKKVDLVLSSHASTEAIRPNNPGPSTSCEDTVVSQ